MKLELEEELLKISEEKGFDLYLIKRALLIAKKAHHSKKRATGEPFIIHPLRIALRIANSQFNEKTSLIIIALLHDVLEEVEGLGENIRQEFEREILEVFGRKIFESVLTLTRNKGEDYFEYLERVKRDNAASIVKYFDILDNLQTLPSSWSKEKIERKLKEWRISLEELKGLIGLE